jgi:3-oxoacyl-[acyl-carrier protein] reductase
MDSGEFEGKVVVVTGASSGIGWHAARLFARAGARLLAHCHRNCDGAAALAAEGDVVSVQADLSQPSGIEPLQTAVQARFGGRVDVLVNNAGSLVRRAPFLALDEPLWDAVMSLNVKSAYLCSRAFLPAMLARQDGAIVNVSSIAGRNGGGLGAVAYSSAKAALIGFTKGLAKEFAPQGIRVNAVSPGTIDTNYHKTFSSETMIKAAVAATPLGRLGRPEEVAEVILFLASQRASYLVGETIEVNGGALMD